MTKETETNGDSLTRIDKKFKEILREIKKRREDLFNERIHKSDRWITMMIIKHNYFKQIKEDIINYEE